MNDYLIEELQEKKELIKDLYNECVSLRGINTGLKKENKDLKQRVNKAIEYIEKFIPIDNDTILMRKTKGLFIRYSKRK